MRHEARTIVVGGGIAGLGLAHALVQRRGDPESVVLLEASPRIGGLIQSVAANGYRVEWAANGFIDNAPTTLGLVKELGLEAALEPSSAAARTRFLYRNGRLHPLPVSPLAFFKSSILSLPGRLRVGWEPFARPAPGGDETVHAFAVRRIGDEAARILVDAMVSGIFAGDSRNLSLESCLPLLKRLETEHGGLLLGMVAKMRAARGTTGDSGAAAARVDAGPGGNLTSFREGMESLPRALGQSLRRVETATPVVRVAARAGGYRLETFTGESFESAELVVAAPPWSAAEIVRSLDAGLSYELATIPAAPIAVVATGFATGELERPLDGFGFLVPRQQGLRMLGCLWDSSIFRHRAPEGRVLLRTMVGGAHDPDVVALEPEAILAIVRAELRQVLGITAVPDFVRVVRHSHGIPQYVPGHSRRLERIATRLAAHRGLHLAGFGYRGIAVNRVLEDAAALAERIASR
jgi:oxygen-dependent protoporphyrinogen oxidase